MCCPHIKFPCKICFGVLWYWFIAFPIIEMPQLFDFANKKETEQILMPVFRDITMNN
jgi:hypothetical protein